MYSIVHSADGQEQLGKCTKVHLSVILQGNEYRVYASIGLRLNGVSPGRSAKAICSTPEAETVYLRTFPNRSGGVTAEKQPSVYCALDLCYGCFALIETGVLRIDETDERFNGAAAKPPMMSR